MRRSCRVCGCTDDRACPGGCSWVEPDLCSACVGYPGYDVNVPMPERCWCGEPLVVVDEFEITQDDLVRFVDAGIPRGRVDALLGLGPWVTLGCSVDAAHYPPTFARSTP